MVGTWLHVSHSSTNRQRQNPAQRSRQPNPKWAAQASGWARNCYEHPGGGNRTLSTGLWAQSPLLSHRLLHRRVEKDPWGWFLLWHILSTLLAVFIREKQNWPQLIFGVGALQFRHFEASKSNQMLSILIEGVCHSPHPSSQTLACLYRLKNIHLQPSVKRASGASAASWPRVPVLLCIVDPVSVNQLALLRLVNMVLHIGPPGCPLQHWASLN